MGLFARLLGTAPPKIPAGAKLIICDAQPLGPMGRAPVWWVAYVLPGDDPDDESKQHSCSAKFDDLGSAQRWRDFCEDPKGHPFTYPTGAV